MKPSITIIIPAYNRERFIEAAIESAIGQSEPADEIIVVDDGSTDRTREIALRFGEAIRVISIENDGSGPSRPRNCGIRAASSSHVMFLDSDDRLESTAVAYCRDILRIFPDIGLICGNYYTVTEGDDIERRRVRNEATTVRRLDSEPIGDHAFRVRQSIAFEAFCQWNFIKMNASTVPKQLCDQLGGFDESLRTANDYDFFLRVLDSRDMVYIDAPLQTIVHHEGNISSVNLNHGFRDFHAKNYIRVLQRQLASTRSDTTKRIITGSIQSWLLELAFEYRESGDPLRSLWYYTKCASYGSRLATCARGMFVALARIVIPRPRASFHESEGEV